MAGGLWVLLAIPAIIAFVFCVWVFYSMVVDVSQRDAAHGSLTRCVEDCVVEPQDAG